MKRLIDWLPRSPVWFYWGVFAPTVILGLSLLLMIFISAIVDIYLYMR
jgi:hypothetical protein